VRGPHRCLILAHLAFTISAPDTRCCFRKRPQPVMPRRSGCFVVSRCAVRAGDKKTQHIAAVFEFHQPQEPIS
jgi:hypothetical protein